MNYAIISDIHANIDAFLAVMEDIGNRKPERIICLGDLVGYCAEPSEVIKQVRLRSLDVVLMGNHDCTVNNPFMMDKMNYHPRLSMIWTIQQLSAAEKEYLSSLPIIHRENNLTFVHATPRNPEGWAYIIYLDDHLDAFNYFDTPLCFIGHSHYPIIVSEQGSVISDRRFKFKNDMRYIVNVGSVGQPRDGNPKACYVLYDSGEGIVEYVRVKYDVARAQDRMRKAHLSEYNINRLSEIKGDTLF